MHREPIHPGEHLAEELQEIGVSARELARELKVPATRVTEILRGRRGISGDTALWLGRYFQVSPDFWMNLQKLYELDLARREIEAELATIVPRRCRSDADPVQPATAD
ncbi:MAG TPA: addiction module antidote protein, HigA family [Rhodospirillaceae bacterium]|nr:addiction module antidote protein, HigA family [Rhodospirillaceae bacterium]HRK96140.1 HigA family addiction module antitoxin [Rhodospirillales bacterium]